MGLTDRMNELRSGYAVDVTEKRAAMHHVLRMPKSYVGKFRARHPRGEEILMEQVHGTLERVREFSEDVREGKRAGCTGRVLRNVICIGIGGFYYGPECVYEALRGDEAAAGAAERKGRRLRFLANIDPVDFDLCTRDLDPEETLVIVMSKSFATAETMQNARSVKRWFVRSLCGREEQGKNDCTIRNNGRNNKKHLRQRQRNYRSTNSLQTLLRHHHVLFFRCQIRDRSNPHISHLGLGRWPFLCLVSRGHAATLHPLFVQRDEAIS